MLISANWLSRHVDLEGVDFNALGERFTLNVAELEGVHHVGQDAASCVVGHVLEAEHVEGTHLNLCQVDTGDAEPRQIICGAPNIAKGQYVPVVLPGQTLGELEVGERKVRGHLSQGMIASERELGLSEEHEGIMVLDGQPTPGTLLGELFEITDTLFEIDNKSLTHRPDCWGHRGIAREVAALLGRPLKAMDEHVAYTEDTPISVKVEDQEACPRYLAVTIDDVSVAPSPFWLRVLLHRVGIRAINQVVDATNFVMLDLGNPLHAFDRREVKGDAIVVRRAEEGERFTTLDDAEHTLSASDLLIGDGERGVALAGIMGGQNSEIRDDTTQVVLEAATFHPSIVRMTASRLGIRTDSSARFEKSLDPELAEAASRAFCRLLLELDPGARVTSALVDVRVPLAPLPVITLPIDLVDRRLGLSLGQDTIVSYLERLGFGVEVQGDSLEVSVPSWRATKDISIPADLIEEIGRSYGYDNIPPAPPAVVLSRPHPNKQKIFEADARTYLTRAMGMDEVMTYSFDTDPHLETIGAIPESRVLLENPISAEMPAMRTQLGPNLLMVLQRNERREEALRVFEIGRIFQPDEDPKALPHQPVTLGGLIADSSLGEDLEAALFFAAKGAINGLARALGRAPLRIVQGGVSHPWAHPVRQAQLLGPEGQCVGYLADAHPGVLHALDLNHRAALFEIDLDAWRGGEEHGATYRPLPRFPSANRDFAVLVDESVRAGAVADAIRGAHPSRVRDVAFQSVYRGQGVPEGQKSMAWSVTFLDEDTTLNDEDVRALETAVWKALEDEVGGTPRA